MATARGHVPGLLLLDGLGRPVVAFLVNLTDPTLMKGSFREPIPVCERRVVVRLPEGRKARRVHLQVAGRERAIEQEGTRLTLAVPSIHVHEVVAIDL
jgi:hypothetical protein